MKPNHRPTSKRIKGFDAPSVWAEFSPLAAEKGAVNMGQGFPNFAAPHFIKKYVGVGKFTISYEAPSTEKTYRKQWKRITINMRDRKGTQSWSNSWPENILLGSVVK